MQNVLKIESNKQRVTSECMSSTTYVIPMHIAWMAPVFNDNSEANVLIRILVLNIPQHVLCQAVHYNW